MHFLPFKNFNYSSEITVFFRGSCTYVNFIPIYMSYETIHFTDSTVQYYHIVPGYNNADNNVYYNKKALK